MLLSAPHRQAAAAAAADLCSGTNCTHLRRQRRLNAAQDCLLAIIPASVHARVRRCMALGMAAPSPNTPRDSMSRGTTSALTGGKSRE